MITHQYLKAILNDTTDLDFILKDKLKSNLFEISIEGKEHIKVFYDFKGYTDSIYLPYYKVEDLEVILPSAILTLQEFLLSIDDLIEINNRFRIDFEEELNVKWSFSYNSYIIYPWVFFTVKNAVLALDKRNFQFKDGGYIVTKGSYTTYEDFKKKMKVGFKTDFIRRQEVQSFDLDPRP